MSSAKRTQSRAAKKKTVVSKDESAQRQKKAEGPKVRTYHMNSYLIVQIC